MNRVLIELDMMRDPNCGIGQFCLNLARELSRATPGDLSITLLVPPTDMKNYKASVSVRSVSHYQRMKRLRWIYPKHDI
jgi:hypothetical protein